MEFLFGFVSAIVLAAGVEYLFKKYGATVEAKAKAQVLVVEAAAKADILRIEASAKAEWQKLFGPKPPATTA